MVGALKGIIDKKRIFNMIKKELDIFTVLSYISFITRNPKKHRMDCHESQED